jgi:DNA-binding IclR family transcriptional regulator
LYQYLELCIVIRNMSLSRSPPSGVGVLDRSVRILEAVEGGARSFTDIVEATELTRPTTHRLVKALEAHGLLMLREGSGNRLGPRVLTMATAAMRDLPLRDLAHPVLEHLARTTGESVQLFVRDVDRRLCVDAVESDSELRTIVEIGSELPLTAGSAGKVFLAFGPAPMRDRIVVGARKLTARTPVGADLTRQLAAVRRVGYATSAGERQPGVGSVSAPVFGPMEEPLAVVSVSGPLTRMGGTGARRHSPAVVAAAHEIERTLGVERS